eukprot:388287_1
MSEWTCQQCTFLNRNMLQQCEICQHKRSSQSIQHTVESDLEFAKQLQQQYNKTNSESMNQGMRSLDLTPSPKKPSINFFRQPNSNPTFKFNIPSPKQPQQHNNNSNSNSNNSNSNNSNSNNSNSNNSNLNNSNSNINNNNNSVSISISNSTVSSNNQNKKSRKRKIEALESYNIEEEEELDSDQLEFIGNMMNDQNHGTKYKIIEQNIEYNSSYSWTEDIIHKLAQDFVPGWNRNTIDANPVIAGKMNVSKPSYVSYCGGSHQLLQLFGRWRYDNLGVNMKSDKPNLFPYFIMDFKDLQIKLNCYRIDHPIYYRYENGASVQYGGNGFLQSWALDGSNDLINWKTIHTNGHSQSSLDSQNTKMVCKEGKYGWSSLNNKFYTKFRFRMTYMNSNFANILKLSSIKLYGQIKRKLEYKPRIDEHKPIDKFPTIPSTKCLGDMNNVFKVLNEYENIQHNECKEYIENIPNLKIQLKDYQKRGLQWMLNIENNGNSDGIHGGLVCDEMGLGK